MRDYLTNIKSGGFTKKTNKGVTFYSVDEITELGIIHGFTTRLGGVSPGVYESLNLSKTREENNENKIKNYKLVCDALDVDYNSLTLVNYEHGNNVHILEQKDKGSGITKTCQFEKCDALITDDPELTAVTLHADCVPIFMVDKKNRVACVAHAGWKGTTLGITGNIIEKLKNSFSSKPEDIIVAIGPHIMDCCFEIKDDTAQKLIDIDEKSVLKKNNLLFGNLQYLILKQLFEKEIPPENTICANLCTYCNNDLFYSHRRDKGLTGAMGAFVNVGK